MRWGAWSNVERAIHSVRIFVAGHISVYPGTLAT